MAKDYSVITVSILVNSIHYTESFSEENHPHIAEKLKEGYEIISVNSVKIKEFGYLVFTLTKGTLIPTSFKTSKR